MRRVLLFLPPWIACACAGQRALDDHPPGDVALERDRPLDTAAAQSTAFNAMVDHARRLAAQRNTIDDPTKTVESADVARDQIASAKCHLRHSCGRVRSCYAEERARLAAWPVDKCSGVRVRDCLESLRAAACLLDKGELPAACDARLVCVRDV